MAKKRGFLGYNALLGDGSVMTSYTPTIGERMTDALRRMMFSDDREGQRRAEKVMDVLSLTPVGMAADVYDAGREAGAGNYGTAGLMLGMAGIPGPSPKKGIRAFHGSPHSFERFDMSKIGTGEGAQAYGHGLYFAENEGVARGYKERLSPTQGQHNAFAGKRLNPTHINRLQKSDDPAIADFFRMYGNKANSTKDLEKFADERIAQNIAERDRFAQRAAEFRANPPYKSTYTAEDYDKFVANYDRNIANLQKVRDQIKHEKAKKLGSMYEVNINADPNAFLDWDKPLIEQPEAVRKAYAKAAAVDDPILSELLDGSTESLQLTGLFPRSSGAQAYNTFTHGNKEAATQRLREAGIPGIKYLDAGSRGAGDGTRNYVVFDDRLIEIVRKYGIAGASAMLGYNLLEGMDPAQAEELKRIEGGR